MASVRFATPAAVLALLAVVILFLPVLPSVPATGGGVGGSRKAATAFGEMPAVDVSEATQGLATGGGLGGSASTLCHAGTPVNANCGATADPRRPSSEIPPSDVWSNASGALALPTLPAGGGGASLAFDFVDHYYVYFGGCAGRVCPDNYTWTYANGFWTNDTAFANSHGESPPARDYGSMDWDVNEGGVLLFGGCGTVCPLRDSWVFRGGTWINVTSTDCATACPVPVFGATMVWDPVGWSSSQGASLLFGGCLDPVCIDQSNQTFLDLGPTHGGWTRYVTGGGKVAPPLRAYGASAFDPVLGQAVLFGGTGPCGAAYTYCSLGDTWTYDSVSGWVNITATIGAGPGARYGGIMTWDNLTREILLYGGYNISTQSTRDDTWTLACASSTSGSCIWTNITETVGTAPGPRFEGSIAENNSDFAPFFVGGWTSLSTTAHDVWQFGVPVGPVTLNVTPNPTTVDQKETAIGSIPSEGGPYEIVWGFPQNGSTIFPGTLTLNFSSGESETLQVRLTIITATDELAGSSAEIFLSPWPVIEVSYASATIDRGQRDSFSASVRNGTGFGTFVYNWTFGDGATGSGPSVNHTFNSTGQLTIAVNVTDSVGQSNTTSLTVTVHADPSILAKASRTVTDLWHQVNFSSAGTNGTGSYNYTWFFDDGTTGFGPDVNHTFVLPGTFRIFGNLTDSVGFLASSEVTIVVEPHVTVTIGANPSTSVQGESVQFAANTSNGVPGYTYFWGFGDGGTGLGVDPSHLYLGFGAFNVSVTVTDSLGNTSTGWFIEKVAQSTPNSSHQPGTNSTARPAESFNNFYVLAIAIGIILAATLAAYLLLLLVRRRRDRDDRELTDEELRQEADGRERILARIRAEGPIRISQLQEGEGAGDPVAYTQLAQWLRSLTTEGLIRGQRGQAGVLEYVAVQRPRVEFDESALDRKDDDDILNP